MPRAIDALTQDVRDDLAELAMKLAANAKTRKPFLNAVKEVDPNRRFPTQEVDDLREEMKTEREREKEERRIEEERRATEARLNAQRSVLVGKGYTEDQLKEVESVMTKYGLTDYEAAADIYERRKPVAPPEAATGTWSFPSIEGLTMDKLVADPTRASRDEAYRVITELKRGRAA